MGSQPEVRGVCSCVWANVPVGAMVRIVVSAPGPVGVTVEGVKRQDSPAGRPPVQAKETVERNPPTGVTARVMALEVPPSAALVLVLDGESVNEPGGLRMVRGAVAEVLGRWAESPI